MSDTDRNSVTPLFGAAATRAVAQLVLLDGKFASMPGFAKSDTGFIALQGDHGQVSFRNIKIRPIVKP